MGYEFFGEKIIFPSTPVPGLNNNQSLTELIGLKTKILMTYQCHVLRKLAVFFSISFLTFIILDTENAACFLTVSFIPLGNGIFSPPKRSLRSF